MDRKFCYPLYERRKLLYNVGYDKMGVNAMQCMKCGREIPVGDVFCQECLDDMKRYPVKPGTAVHIPKQQPKKPQERRPVMTPERKVEVLSRRVRVLSWLLTLAVALAICLGALTLSMIREGDTGFAIGQNYSAGLQTESTDATE